MFGYQKRVTIYKLEFGIKKYTVIHSITSPELFLCAYTTLFVHIYIHTHSYIYIYMHTIHTTYRIFFCINHKKVRINIQGMYELANEGQTCTKACDL